MGLALEFLKEGSFFCDLLNHREKVVPSKSIEERKSQDPHIRQRGKFESPLSEIPISLNLFIEEKINSIVPGDNRPGGSELTASVTDYELWPDLIHDLDYPFCTRIP